MARQKVSDEELVKAIVEFVDKNGFSPTVRELCKIVGLSSTATMHRRLCMLRDKGRITFNPILSRTIKAVK